MADTTKHEDGGVLRRSGIAMLVWFGEAVVGLVPLLAHYGIAAAATLPEHEALCTANFASCRWGSSTPYAEICILAVVIAGVSAVAALGYGHHIRRSDPNGLTYLLFFLSIAACVVGIGMYVAATAGILREEVGWATWTTLAAALAASLFLSLERAIR